MRAPREPIEDPRGGASQSTILLRVDCVTQFFAADLFDQLPHIARAECRSDLGCSEQIDHALHLSGQLSLLQGARCLPPAWKRYALGLPQQFE